MNSGNRGDGDNRHRHRLSARRPRADAMRSSRQADATHEPLSQSHGQVLTCLSARALSARHAAGAARRPRSTPGRRASRGRARGRADRAGRSARGRPDRPDRSVSVTRRTSSARREASVSTSSSMPSPRQRRDAERRRILLLQPAPLVRRQLIALVVDLEQRHVGRAHLFEHLAHGGHPPLAVGRRRVDDVQHEIGLRHFLERRAKRRDQRVRQTIDEPDRVRHEQLAAVGQPDLPDERIERDEQRIGRLGARRASAR